MAEPYELGIELSRKNFGSGSLYALGIGAASFASGELEWDLGAGKGTEPVEVTSVSTNSTTGSGESEQRYSGKPDGFAGTPKSIND